MLANVCLPQLVIDLVELALCRLDFSFEFDKRVLRCIFFCSRRGYDFFSLSDFQIKNSPGARQKIFQLTRQLI
jgi:hypothetical protein